jgi:hypothetical protein
MTVRLILFSFIFLCHSGILKAQPKLSFFNEMKSPELAQFFADTSIIPTLNELNAEIRMGLLDLSPERVQVVKKLNEAGIPVVAWLLLSKEEGYFFHSGNGELAIQRYKDIKKWADNNELGFAGMGLDLELDFNDIELAKHHKWQLIKSLTARLYDEQQIVDGRKTYNRLLDLIKADGYQVESYYASFVKDEAKNGTTSIQQLTKFLDVKLDKEIPMLYTSFFGNPYGVITIYGQNENLKHVALGSTGGGIDTTMNTLTWEELSYDLRLASTFADEVHIFSLEGSVWKGYLKKLVGFDYNLPVEKRPEEIKNVENVQLKVILVSNILSYPTLIIISLILVLILTGYILFRIGKFAYRKIYDTV